MIYLLDTHLLLWSIGDSQKLSRSARECISDPRNRFCFSSASIWELSIKALRRPDTFKIDVEHLRDSLLLLGYQEISIESSHGLATKQLPFLHHDPFDRILIAQAIVEGLTLATVDEDILRYSAPTLNLS
ncbi:MAG: type II toxin-antitoxin system VapC family toxin [Terriglobus sp.]